MNNPSGDSVKNLVVQISYQTDQQSAQQAQADIQALTTAIQQLTGAANQAGGSGGSRGGGGGGSGTSGLDPLNQDAGALRVNLGEVRNAMFAIRTESYALRNIGSVFAAIGKEMSQPFLDAQKEFLKTADAGNTVANQWKQTTDQITAAHDRLGQVVTQQLLPGYRELANLNSQFADFAQAHPDLAAAATIGGQALVTLGDTLKTAAQAIYGFGAIGPALQIIQSRMSAGGINPVVAAGGGTIGEYADLQAIEGGSPLAGGAIGAALGAAPAAASIAAIAGAGIAVAGGVAAIVSAAIHAPDIQSFIQHPLAGPTGQPIQILPLQAQQGGLVQDILQKPATPLGGPSISDVYGAIGKLIGQALGTTPPEVVTFTSNMLDLHEALREAAAKTQDFDQALNQISFANARQGIVEAKYQLDQENTGAYATLQSSMGSARYAEQQKLQEIDLQGDQERLRLNQEYQNQETAAVASHGAEIARIQSQQHLESVRMQEDFSGPNGSYTKMLRDEHTSEMRFEEDYYAARAIRARDFGIEIQRLEEDHQTQMFRAAQDNSVQIFDLAAKRDALGLANEMQKYETDRQRKEEDYQKEISRKNADYAKEISDQEAQFQKERSRRLADYKQQQDDAVAQYELEKQRRKDDNQTRLDELNTQFQLEQDKRATDYQQRLNDLDENIRQQKIATQTAYQKQIADLVSQYDAETVKRWDLFRQYVEKTLPAMFAEEEAKKLADEKKIQDDFDKMLGNIDQALRARFNITSAPSSPSSGPPGSPAEPGAMPGSPSGGMIWPVGGPGNITQQFQGPNVGEHTGLDIGVPKDTPIAAPLGGTIISEGWNSQGYGNLIIMDNGNGITTYFAHQDYFAAPLGATLAQGQTLGYVDSTGNSSGNHLHFEVRQNNIPQNPLNYLGGQWRGGYIGRGLYTGGEGGMEFVLNNQTTSMLGQAVGGRLTQEKILSLAVAGANQRRAPVSVSSNQTHVWNSSLTALERDWMRDAARSSAQEALEGLLA